MFFFVDNTFITDDLTDAANCIVFLDWNGELSVPVSRILNAGAELDFYVRGAPGVAKAPSGRTHTQKDTLLFVKPGTYGTYLLNMIF